MTCGFTHSPLKASVAHSMPRKIQTRNSMSKFSLDGLPLLSFHDQLSNPSSRIIKFTSHHLTEGQYLTRCDFNAFLGAEEVVGFFQMELQIGGTAEAQSKLNRGVNSNSRINFLGTFVNASCQLSCVWSWQFT